MMPKHHSFLNRVDIWEIIVFYIKDLVAQNIKSRIMLVVSSKHKCIVIIPANVDTKHTANPAVR